MSQLLINDYLKQLDVIKKASGSHRETIVREAFKGGQLLHGSQAGVGCHPGIGAPKARRLGR
jgi:hypothetical protein